ncbi:MAG: phosphatidate cytidylyltransferase [Pseudomonadota bacterium]|nr:phosphatidate cytidylyltransferase [Pseudomonadota bacterium]
MRTRILTALVLVPLTVAALFLLPSRAWAALTLMVVLIASSEWAALSDFRTPAKWLFVAAMFVFGVGMLYSPWTEFDAGGSWPDALVLSIYGAATLFWVAIAPPWLYFGWRIRFKPILLLVGALVLAATWISVVQLQARSPALLLALMAIVWVADTAAYFAGRRFGKCKLAPAISPGKTWEGVYGALIAVALYALALLPFAHDAGYSNTLVPAVVAVWIAMVLALATLSIVGDLFESQLKRQRGVKDSGRMLPGHGGVLDRIDALMAALPPAALIAHYLIQ